MSTLKPRAGVSNKTANRRVARSNDVALALIRTQLKLSAKAHARLAAHHRTGQHTIWTYNGKVDRYVALVGPSAVAIESGHINKRTGNYTPGLAIMRGAVREMI
jgi:hypothetical protein